ncbi:MAG: hypothetical protein U1E27_13235, partial [Kiritimatiellia bacterium]|nr:hypothetical protein [Kiritimatiellia bacterium]
IAEQYIPFASGEHLGRVVDRIGLFLVGKPGDRVVVYVDDLRITGTVPTREAYARQTEARWAPVSALREKAFAQLHGILADIRATLESTTFQTEGAKFLAGRVLRQVPEWESRLQAAESSKDLRPTAFEGLRYAMEAGTKTLATIRDVEARNLSFDRVIFYALDNPIVNLRILPRDLVPPARIATDLNLVAAQGEHRSASLIVQALQDLESVRVTVSDLTHESGEAILPADTVDRRVVKAWYQAGTAWDGIAQKRELRILTPELLLYDDALVRVNEETRQNELRLSFPDGDRYWNTEDPEVAQERHPTLLSVEHYPVRDAKILQPTSIPAETLKSYWLTLRTPEQARPGLYTGTVTVASADSELGKLGITVRILPFRLPMPKTYYAPDREFISSIYYRAKLDPERYPQGTISSEYKSEEQLRAEFRDMWDHGIFNPTSYQPFSHLATYLRIREESGMGGMPLFSLGASIGSPETDAQLKEMEARVRRKQAIVSQFGIRELYLYGIDEAQGDRLMSQRRAWAKVRELGARMFVAGYKGHFDQIGDLLHMQVQANVPTREEAAQWHSAGHRILCYANPQTGPENPEVFRRNFGLYLWRMNYDGAMTYAYQHSFGNIYDDFDHATYREHVFSYPTVDGVIPTLAIAGYREGVDDIRYGTLLQSLILEHRDGAKSDMARQAADWIEQVDLNRDLDEVRAEMVEWILRLSDPGD